MFKNGLSFFESIQNIFMERTDWLQPIEAIICV